MFFTFSMLSEYWENEGQNWAKSKLYFPLYELLHEQISVFFSLKFILPRPKQNRGRIFIIFKYFLNDLFLIVFVQNVISKFVKVLPQSQFARIHTSSLLKIEKILNRPITKFYNSNDVNVIAAGLRLTKTRPTSFYKKHYLL